MMHEILEFLNRRVGGRLAQRSLYVYIGLAILCSAFAFVDTQYTGLVNVTETKIYDLLIRSRVFTKKPDPAIVIIDIDEGSLQEMAKQAGRWPWPNHIFADLLNKIEQQAPTAVVFDILFSDADKNHPDSDAALNAAVAQSRTAFFPMVRLAPENDAKSRIKTAWLPGAERLPAVATADTTIAVILPQIPAALDSARMGFLNVTPDKDGVLRRYPTYLDHDGWRFDSYGARVARQTGSAPPSTPQFLLNWHGGAFSYTYLSFKDVYATLGAQGANVIPSFKDKIVIIGSTAPALFDIKATPVATMYPGVEILATAIDNLKQKNPIRILPNFVPPLIGILFIWLVTYGFFRNIPADKINLLFSASQFGFIATSYIVLSLFDFYIDLSAAITYGLIYFTVAKLYSGWHRRHLASLDRLLNGPDACKFAHLTTIRLPAGDQQAADIAELCLLNWLETAPPNTRVYLPGEFASYSLDILIASQIVLIVFSATEADGEGGETVRKLQQLCQTVETQFQQAGLPLPYFAARKLQLPEVENALEYLRSEIQSCQMPLKEPT